MKRNQITVHYIIFVITIAIAFQWVVAEDKNNIIKTGKMNIYKTMTPKSDFVGFPYSFINGRPLVRKPVREDDFDIIYIRIIFVADREQKRGKRKVLRIDKVDEEGGMLIEGLYFAYVDVTQEGIRVICRYKDDHVGVEELGIRKGIPFPLTCTKSPGSGFKNGNSEGYMNIVGHGVHYIKKDICQTNGLVEIEAVRFKNSEGLKEKKVQTAQWYKSDIEDVMNNSKTHVLFREQQRWSSVDAGLWDEMERFDKDGNILMRCKRVKLPKSGNP